MDCLAESSTLLKNRLWEVVIDAPVHGESSPDPSATMPPFIPSGGDTIPPAS
jgi:hypothetical protein